MNNRKVLTLLSIWLIIPFVGFSQMCPNMSTYCADAPLICGLNQLNNNSACSLVSPAIYVGDRCNEVCYASPDNQVHYVFTTNGEHFTITLTVSNCQNDLYPPSYWGVAMVITSACCSGNLNLCTPVYCGPSQVCSGSLSGKLPSCQIYYLYLDGLNGSYCDYFLTVSGGASNVPLVLKNINNLPGKLINLNRGTCNYKFTVEPRDAPCEGYYEWTLDGVPIDDHYREIKLDFPDEGDFQICVQGYIGLPDLNCGQSNLSCTKVEVRQEHRTGNARILCNETKGYKWHKLSITQSGFYQQEFIEKCHVFDSTLEFIILPKPSSGIVNFISCNKSDVYFDPIWKEHYRKCTSNKKILIPKSSEVYSCDSSYILNVAYVDLQNKMYLNCKNGSIYMIPELSNYTDTCGIGLKMTYQYNWFEKNNNSLQFLSQEKELKIVKKGNFQLQVILSYKLATEEGTCIVIFDENIDEDTYLIPPKTSSLIGKTDLCKGDIECYSIDDIVRNPFSFSWSVEEGTIQTQNPNQSNKVCVIWDKNSMMSKGKICVSYADSCSSNLKACLDVEFGKSQKDIAGPNQQRGGVLGAKLNAKGKTGLWTYAGGPGTVFFTDPTDPKTQVRVSRFGSYEFKWTIIEDGCEIYGYVRINFYIEFPELEGEYFRHFYNEEGKTFPFKKIKSHYYKNQLTIEGESIIDSDIQFQLINIQGKILFSKNIKTIGSKFCDRNDLCLTPGIYFLIIENNMGRKVNKILIY